MHDLIPHARPRRAAFYPDGRCPCGEIFGCTNVGGRTRRCMRKSRRNATGRCHNEAVLSSGACRMHGGKSLAGPASPRFRTGRHSTLLNGLAIGKQYEHALQDPKLLELTSEIALVNARIDEMLLTCKRRTIGAESRALDAAWPAINECMESKRKLVATATKRIKALEGTIQVDRVVTVFSCIADVVKTRVKDRTVLAEVLGDMRALFEGARDERRPEVDVSAFSMSRATSGR